MSRSIRKETSSFTFGMVGQLGGSSAGFVVAALNAASATSREVVVLRVLSAGILCPLARLKLSAGKFHFEPPSCHSITSSARASTVGGTSTPSALAVLRLITSSNRVG